MEAAAEERANVRDEDEATDEPAEGAEGHGEAEGVVEACAGGGFGEGVVVLEGAEAAGEHAVAEEVWGAEVFCRDERDVVVGEAELHAFPADGVAGGDVAGGAAGYWVHAEFFLHDGDAGGELEAEGDGGLDEGGGVEGEGSHRFNTLRCPVKAAAGAGD